MLEFAHSVIVRVPNSPRYRASTIAEDIPDLGQVPSGFPYITRPLISYWATRGVRPSHPVFTRSVCNATRDPHESNRQETKGASPLPRPNFIRSSHDYPST